MHFATRDCLNSATVEGSNHGWCQAVCVIAMPKDACIATAPAVQLARICSEWSVVLASNKLCLPPLMAGKVRAVPSMAMLNP